MTPRVALTIAGSDSGGGAGIQADLKTFAAHGVHGVSVVTAVTAQNTREVTASYDVGATAVLAQLDAVIDDLPPAAVKTGMLANAQTVTAIARSAASGELPQLVVDPVLVSTTGHALLGEDGLPAYRNDLLPRAVLCTPNLLEAAALLGRTLGGSAALRDGDPEGILEVLVDLGTGIRELGPTFVLIKGGHLDRFRHSSPVVNRTESSPDVLVGPNGVVVLEAPRIATHNDHGTGCTLSAAIAARLALGDAIEPAVRAAKDFVTRSLLGAQSWNLGSGRGPVDHFGWTVHE